MYWIWRIGRSLASVLGRGQEEIEIGSKCLGLTLHHWPLPHNKVGLGCIA